MKPLSQSLPYRSCVGVVLVNRDGRIFVGRRKDTPDAWQMPQGGIDKGETPREAALRELLEETGTDRAEFLAEIEGWLRYDLPEALAGKLWRGRYRGQEQKWIAFRFTGGDSDIDLDAARDDEFDAWRWSDPDEVLESIVPFKREVYAAVLEAFAPLLAKMGGVAE